MKKSVYVFDIDGTLADLSHRLHFIEGKEKDWDSFYHNVKNDSIIPQNVMTFLMLRNSMPHENLLFVTGRPERTREDTEMWLARNVFMSQYIPTDTLFMREDDDHRKDYEVKEELYHKFIEPNYNVIAVFEDRKQVVDMWRKLGITCYQVAGGNY